MRLRVKPLKTEIMKNLFKITFESGKTYYGLTKVKNVESFIKMNINLGQFHLNNPQIHPITNFETLLLNESCKGELIGSGEMSELSAQKDNLVENDVNCINVNKTLTNKKKNEKIVLGSVKKEYIKRLTKGNQTIQFIDKNVGIKKGFSSEMKFNEVHPLNSNFCLITGSVNVLS